MYANECVQEAEMERQRARKQQSRVLDCVIPQSDTLSLITLIILYKSDL